RLLGCLSMSNNYLWQKIGSPMGALSGAKTSKTSTNLYRTSVQYRRKWTLDKLTLVPQSEWPHPVNPFLHSQDPTIHANGGRSPVGKPAGLGVVENGVVWDNKMLAAEPDCADSRAWGGISGTAESWELDVRCDGTSDTDPARRDTLRRAEPCSGHSRYPLERPRTRRGGQPCRVAGRHSGQRSPCGSLLRAGRERHPHRGDRGQGPGPSPQTDRRAAEPRSRSLAGSADRGDQAAQHQAFPPVDRGPANHLPAAGRDRRRRAGSGQNGIQPLVRGHQGGDSFGLVVG